MTPKFNAAAAHGIVSPAYDGAGLVQGEHYFSPSGEYLFSEKEGGDRWTEGGKAKTGAPAPVSTPSPEAKTDLAAWARGEVRIPFFTVKKLVSEAHPDIDAKNTETIKAGLVSAGVVTAEEASI